jgi:hypothetical protein
VVFNGEGDIAFSGGDGPTRILIGSARKHPHDLVMGPSSVHTNPESLQKGQTRIRAIGKSLAQQGLLRKWNFAVSVAADADVVLSTSVTI